MKLLNCKLLQIEEFHGTSIPKSYAILSHRWGDEEITYQDFQTPRLGITKAGWTKVNDFCRIALENNYEYGWVDTCCIDKQNLTELTEAINSMFKWYASSSVCIAYLSDTTSEQPIEGSSWFTRGWTLQELIAPSRIMFYDQRWEFIGTRDALSDAIQRRSRVDKEILSDAEPRNITSMLSKISVARRMSWASDRTTTREEDRAYSLLGIFGVNMPMLYGEGDRAFIRLQEEIARETNDLSLFAWTRQEVPCSSPVNTPGGSTGAALHAKELMEPCGIFATSPDDFRSSDDVLLKRDIKYNPEFTVTNKGLKIAIEAEMAEERSTWRVSLGCRKSGSDHQDSIAILLKELGGGEFARWNPHRLIQLQGDYQGHETTFYVKKFVNEIQIDTIYNRSIQFHVEGYVKFENATPRANWNSQTAMFITSGVDIFEGFVFCYFKDFEHLDHITGNQFVIACGFGQGDDEAWACMGFAKGPNHLLFAVAGGGDLHSAGILGYHASQPHGEVTRAYPDGEFKIKMHTGHLVGDDEVLHIFIRLGVSRCVVL